MVLDLVSALNSPEIGVRVDTIEKLARQPIDARPKLAAILVEPTCGIRARVWAMIALCQVGCDAGDVAEQALVRCVNDPEAVVRRSAIDVLGHLRIGTAVPSIAAHLNDHDPIEEAWFEDHSTPSQAAKRALRTIGSPEALALLAKNEGP
jgi:HEAT repeat protein